MNSIYLRNVIFIPTHDIEEFRLANVKYLISFLLQTLCIYKKNLVIDYCHDILKHRPTFVVMSHSYLTIFLRCMLHYRIFTEYFNDRGELRGLPFRFR